MYHARYEKPLKTTPYLWQQNVETYSPSNAVALDLEEEVFLTHPSKKNNTRKGKRNQQEKTD